MSSGLIDQQLTHPLVRLVDALEELLGEDAGELAWTLTPNELSELLPRLARAKNQLAAVELRILREADRHQVGDRVGAASTAGWWANQTRATKPLAHRAVALASRLDDDQHATVRAAFAAGEVSEAQAAVILDAVDALPGELVSPEIRRDAERHLVGFAEHHDPRELRLLGRRILELVAPDVAEEHERRRLEREEQLADATATFAMNPDGHGSMIGRFKIPLLAGEMLAKHLAAIAAPRHQAATSETSAARQATGTSERVARPIRLGRAFTEYVETRAADDTPSAGGIAATVVVTMTLESLLGDEAAASLDTGERISASEARRLACEAGIIPAVLGSRSQPLDLGRKTRFHTATQRHALALRDRGCAAEGCDWPPGMCHAHHPTPWSKGGATSVVNGMLLCPRHHTLAHDARFQLKTGKSGKVTFNRRT